MPGGRGPPIPGGRGPPIPGGGPPIPASEIYDYGGGGEESRRKLQDMRRLDYGTSKLRICNKWGGNENLEDDY